MSQEYIKLLTIKFNLNQVQQIILSKATRKLSRLERRIYFESLKPLEREFKIFFKEQYQQLDQEGRQLWMDTIVKSLLNKGGDPAIIDSLLMDVIGRLEVYRNLRERSEEEGHILKPLTTFGGLSMVLFAMVIITAFILYLMTIY